MTSVSPSSEITLGSIHPLTLTFWHRGAQKMWHLSIKTFSALSRAFQWKSEISELEDRVFFLQHCFPKKTLLYEMVHEAEDSYPQAIDHFYILVGKEALGNLSFRENFWKSIWYFSSDPLYVKYGKRGVVNGEETLFSSLSAFYQHQLKVLKKEPITTPFTRADQVHMSAQITKVAALITTIGGLHFLSEGNFYDSVQQMLQKQFVQKFSEFQPESHSISDILSFGAIAVAIGAWGIYQTKKQRATNEKLQKISEEKEEVQAQLGRSQNQCQKVEQDLLCSQEANQTLQNKLTINEQAYKAKIAVLQNLIEEKQAILTKVKKLNELLKNSSQQSAEVEELQKKIEANQPTIDALNKNIAQQEEQKEKLQKQVEENQSAIEALTKEAELILKQKKEIKESISESKQAVEKMQEQKAILATEIERLNKELEAQKNKQESLQKQIEENREKLRQQAEEIEKLQKQNESLNKELEDLKTREKILQQQINTHQKAIEALGAKISQPEEQTENHEEQKEEAEKKLQIDEIEKIRKQLKEMPDTLDKKLKDGLTKMQRYISILEEIQKKIDQLNEQKKREPLEQKREISEPSSINNNNATEALPSNVNEMANLADKLAIPETKIRQTMEFTPEEQKALENLKKFANPNYKVNIPSNFGKSNPPTICIQPLNLQKVLKNYETKDEKSFSGLTPYQQRSLQSMVSLVTKDMNLVNHNRTPFNEWVNKLNDLLKKQAKLPQQFTQLQEKNLKKIATLDELWSFIASLHVLEQSILFLKKCRLEQLEKGCNTNLTRLFRPKIGKAFPRKPPIPRTTSSSFSCPPSPRKGRTSPISPVATRALPSSLPPSPRKAAPSSPAILLPEVKEFSSKPLKLPEGNKLTIEDTLNFVETRTKKVRKDFFDTLNNMFPDPQSEEVK